MRTSDYNIYVPLPDAEEHILIHGYSGAVDVVPNHLAIFLQNFKDEAGETFPDNEQIEALKKRGYLTEKTPDQEREFVKKLGQILNTVQRKNAGFLVMPTYDCNFRCPYCYEKRLRRKGRAWMEKTMDRPTVEAAYRAMESVREDLKLDERVPRRITLYGGEPFLKRNAEIVNYICRRGGELGYEFSAVTNGSELDGFLPLLGTKQGQVSWMQITLDGPPAIHDRRRCRADGSGSFADIARNITVALEQGATVSVRTNVDQSNVKHIPELTELYTQYGWVKNKNFSAYCNAVTMISESTKQQGLLSAVSLTQLVQAGDQWHPSVQLLTPNKNMEIKFLQLLEGDGYPHLSPTFCGSQSGMYLFDPHGELYICWDSVGEPVGHVGSYAPEFTLDQAALAQWQGRTVMSIPECVACKYALLCGGGCSQHAYYANGTLKSPYCDDFGALFCAAVPEAYRTYREKTASADSQACNIKHDEEVTECILRKVSE